MNITMQGIAFESSQQLKMNITMQGISTESSQQRHEHYNASYRLWDLTTIEHGHYNARHLLWELTATIWTLQCKASPLRVHNINITCTVRHLLWELTTITTTWTLQCKASPFEISQQQCFSSESSQLRHYNARHRLWELTTWTLQCKASPLIAHNMNIEMQGFSSKSTDHEH